MVPDVEVREAAHHNGYTWEAWQQLRYRERVYGLAYYRIRRLIEMNQHDAQERETKRQHQQQARKGRKH